MTIGAFIIARMGSTRLPGKNMLKIMDKPLIELFVERVKAARLVDKIVIATSTNPSDDPLNKLADKLKIGCFRGSLVNIMDRVHNAAKKYNCDTIIELLGDNSLIHSELIDDVVKFYKDGGYDYAATVTKEYPVSPSRMKLFSVGVRVQVYSKKVAAKWSDYPELIKNEEKSTTAYMFENPDVFKIGYFEAKGKWSFMNAPDLTFAVNYKKNFDLMRIIFEKNYPEDNNFSLKKAYEQLEKEKGLYQLMGNE